MGRAHHHALDHRLPANARKLRGCSQSPPKSGGLFLVLIIEALNATFSIDELVLAREERMAHSANFDLDVLFGRARLKAIAASAGD